MLFKTNFLFLFFTILPIFLYSFVVFLNTPYNSTDIWKGIKFIVLGMFSPMLVLTFHFLFPDWGDKLSLGDVFLEVFISAFIQVAMLEEVSKFIVFKFVNKTETENNPMSILFYCMMTSAGFALLENFHYVQSIWSNGQTFLKTFPNIITEEEVNRFIWSTIVLRAFTAVVAHMITGAMMGYFLAKASMKTKVEDKSVLTVFLRRNVFFKKIFYSIIAILVATIFHGLYDFNLMYSSATKDNVFSNMFLVIILAGGLFVTYLMGKKIASETEAILEQKKENH